MSSEIAIVLGILSVAFVLFVTERLRMDLVALLVLSALALTGLVGPAEALSGFSNPAVITVWAMFILSAGLTNAGLAELLGRRLLGLSGGREPVAAIAVMLTAGILSAFMNNIGVAALMLPVVMNISRRSGISPSRLLMPLAFGCLLGGLTTLIGTPPNLLVSNALRQAGHQPFGMFDFMPVGGSVLLVGSAFIVLVGRHLLPRRDPAREVTPRSDADLRQLYEVDRLSAVLRVPAGSDLDGRPLENSRLGVASGLNVYAIVREGEVEVAPDPKHVLRSGDRLLVHGRLDRFEELRAWREFVVQRRNLDLEDIAWDDVGLCEVRVCGGSDLIGATIGEADLRRRWNVIVLAVRRGPTVLRRRLAQLRLAEGDALLLYGRRRARERVLQTSSIEIGTLEPAALAASYQLREHLYAVRVPADSVLVGSSLLVSRLGEALGVRVLALRKGDGEQRIPAPEEAFGAGDELIVHGDPGELQNFRALQMLEVDSEKTSVALLEAQGFQLVEAMLAPRSSLAGRTLRELEFRQRYGLDVLALLRGGHVHHSRLANTAIKLGDALLCVGTDERAAMLRRDPDFLVLNIEQQETLRRKKAPIAAAVMAAVVAAVLLGFLPISIAAVAGATVMVLLGCLSMEQAYRSIEWRSVFLIAGMLPLGLAMETSGAAAFLARGVVTALSPLGPWGVVVGLYLMTALLTSVVPTAALVVLVAPIVLDTAAQLGLSERALMMAVAMAASASFTSPISHPANVLVMGPGGYRFIDYVRLGVPLTIVVMAVVMLTLPLFWPLQP